MYARLVISLQCAARSSQAMTPVAPLSPAKDPKMPKCPRMSLCLLMYKPPRSSCISFVALNAHQSPLYPTKPPAPIISLGSASILPQTRPHIRPTPLLELLGIFPPHPRGFHVGGALVVGTAQHADDGEEDGLGGLDGGPALGGVLVAVGVVLRAVEDGDADFA